MRILRRHHRGRLLVRIRRATPPLFDPRLKRHALNYAFQPVLATLTLLTILLVGDVVLNAAIVDAMASTVFTIFVVPDSIASTPRRVVGGHTAGVVAGSAVAAVVAVLEIPMAADSARAILVTVAALTVCLSIVLMVLTNTEHPPAAGAALGLVIHDWSLWSVGVILVSAVALSILRAILRPRLVNLL